MGQTASNHGYGTAGAQHGDGAGGLRLWLWGGWGYGAGRLMTWLWGRRDRGWLWGRQHGPRARPASWGHPPCPNQPIRRQRDLTSPVTRQTSGQRAPLGTLPAAALAAGQHPWVPPPGGAAGAAGGPWGGHCTLYAPAGQGLARGGHGRAAGGHTVLGVAFPWCPSATAAL